MLRRSERAFFVHGFAKSARENLRLAELRAVRALADEMLGLHNAALNAMLANGTISEVICDG
ncbi:MAG: type II toxin-antitoxin system RelE/ParE family toxin [Bryobacterales bacterium]|nr:type II toxin-antitoxin system RelE/ParE family toxin [Bryobacterales bacterium]MDE0264659.1 type II toxin-antitoxin system RelE/ParE family toxin [Bryobacterales bacterium]MDE0624113.1 type II toxin-antitoxin system RelE/ParE family toxin [Bryobacterales bacterium]